MNETDIPRSPAPPVIGTAEAAVLSCVNLIARAADVEEARLSYWLDLYYQTRRRYEQELEAAEAARKHHELLTEIIKETKPRAPVDKAEAAPAEKEEQRAEPSAPPYSEPPAELKGFEPVKPKRQGHSAPKGNNYGGEAAAFKRATRDRLEKARGRGVTVSAITDTANGAITAAQVLDILEAKPLPVAVYRVLAAALDKIES